MMTFDELVDRTLTLLESKPHRGITYSRGEVEKVLSETEVSVFLQTKDQTTTADRIIVRCLAFQGNKYVAGQETEQIQYRRKFASGLNAWVASNFSGKSTILKLIVWALTGTKPNFKESILAWIEGVAVEIEIPDDGTYTIQYSPRPEDPGVVGGIWASDIDTVLKGENAVLLDSFIGIKEMKNAVARFMSKRLGFYSLDMVQQRQNSVKLQHTSVDWDVYSQALYISADEYTDYLFPHGKFDPKQTQRTLGMYLGFELLKAASLLQSRHLETQNQLQLEKQVIQVHADQTRRTIEQFEAELERVNQSIQQIDAGESILVDPEYERVVREKYTGLAEQKRKIQFVIEEMLTEESRIKGERNTIRRAFQEMREALQFRLFLSGIEVVRCPHCENPIPQVKVNEELASGHCRICSSELRHVSHTEEQETWLAEMEKRHKALDLDLKRIGKEITQKRKEQQNLAINHTQAEQAFRDLNRQEREGFKAEIRALINRAGYLSGQLEHLRLQTEEGQKERLGELETKVNILARASSTLQAHVQSIHEETQTQLEELTTDFAIRFGVPFISRVFLNKDFMMFVADESRKSLPYGKMDLGERLRLKIAFHLALLIVKVKHNVGRHPGILIIDAPGAAEMSDEFFKSVLQGLEEIEIGYSEKVQILVASARDELASICTPDKLEQKITGTPLF